MSGPAFSDLAERVSRVEMQMDLLYSVVERTGQQVEGYYALRQVNDLMKQVGNFPRYEDALRHIDNVLATMQAAIDRLDR